MSGHRFLALLLSAILVHGAEPLVEPNAAGIIVATEAANGLSGLSEIDFGVLARDRNRGYFEQQTVEGSSLVASRRSLRHKVERTVTSLGDVQGKYAELAGLVVQLWQLADAESAIVTGAEPIDDALVEKMKELTRKTRIVRDKIRPLLPPGVELYEPTPDAGL